MSKRVTSGRAKVTVQRHIEDIDQIQFPDGQGRPRLRTLVRTSDGKAAELIESEVSEGVRRRYWLELPDINKDFISIEQQKEQAKPVISITH